MAGKHQYSLFTLLCPRCKIHLGVGGLCPRCKIHRGDYVHAYKNEQEGFCPGRSCTAPNFLAVVSFPPYLGRALWKEEEAVLCVWDSGRLYMNCCIHVWDDCKPIVGNVS